MAETEDLYEILHLHPSAHPDVVQAAYRRLALLDTDPGTRSFARSCLQSMVELSAALMPCWVIPRIERNTTVVEHRSPNPHPKKRTRADRRGSSGLDYDSLSVPAKTTWQRIQGPPNWTASHWRDTSTRVSATKTCLTKSTWTYPDFGIYLVNRSGRGDRLEESLNLPSSNVSVENMDSAKIKLLGSNDYYCFIFHHRLITRMMLPSCTERRFALSKTGTQSLLRSRYDRKFILTLDTSIPRKSGTYPGGNSN